MMSPDKHPYYYAAIENEVQSQLQVQRDAEGETFNNLPLTQGIEMG
jgi:hypothetical protein